MATGSTEQKTPKAAAQEVVYTGVASVAKMSKANWAKAKVEDQDGVEWSADNDYRVPVSDLNEAALKALAKDDRFKVRDVKADA